MTVGDATLVSNNTVSDEIVLCLKTLLSVKAGTQPMDRDFGIDAELADLPIDVFKNKFALEIISKVDKYEPRVVVNKVTFEYGEGQLTPKVHFSLADTEADDE